MMIKHKGITHERTEDAPFIGALICANDCKIGCKNCFNQHLKTSAPILQTIDSILDEVEGNIFNEGIILAGLEWSMQPNALIKLVKAAISRKLKIMVYTGHDKETFILKTPEVLTLKGDIYIKHGSYNVNFETNNNFQYSVKLASANQYIESIKEFVKREYRFAV